MSFDLSVFPEPLATTIKELSKKIEFKSANEKGAGWPVLIGVNRQIGRKVAVKFYDWSEQYRVEPKILCDLASPNILEVDDAAAIDNEHAYFVTPFCERGDLDNIIQMNATGVRSALDLILDVASGVNFIHAKGFIHRDLKPSNIFCENDGRLVIGDFGSIVKKGIHGYAQTLSRHTLIYRTPEEIVNGRAYEQGDIYQLGIVLYQILGGYFPYDQKSWLTAKQIAESHKLGHPDNQIYASRIIEEKILRGKLLKFSSLPAWCPRQLVSVIRKCCKVNFSDRFQNVSAVMAQLNNIRSSLPDWRLEPHPVLYRPNLKYKLIESHGNYRIEKLVKSGTNWRKVHLIKCSTIEDVIKAVEAL